MSSYVKLRRATTAMYCLLTILPAAVLALLVYEPPRLPLAYIFSNAQSRWLALAIFCLAIGSLVIAALIPRADTRAAVRRLMIPAAVLVGLAFAWNLIAPLIYAMGLGYLLLLQREVP